MLKYCTQRKEFELNSSAILQYISQAKSHQIDLTIFKKHRLHNCNDENRNSNNKDKT